MIFAAFDLDGTITNSLSLIDKALRERGYRPMLDGKRAFNFDFEEGYCPPPDFIWELFFYRLFTDRFDEIELIDEHVDEFLQRIYSVGNEPIRIITARPRGMLMHWSTEKLLKRLVPNVKFSIDIVPDQKEKQRYMMGCDVFFDDRRKTVLEMSKHHNIVFMRKTNYNDLGNVKSMHIRDVGMLDTKAGDIVVYDDFGQLIEAGVHRFVAPFLD